MLFGQGCLVYFSFQDTMQPFLTRLPRFLFFSPIFVQSLPWSTEAPAKPAPRTSSTKQ